MSAQQESVLAAPPVIVSAASLFGYSMSDLVFMTTLAYTVLLFVHRIWKWRNEINDRDTIKYGRRATDNQEDE